MRVVVLAIVAACQQHQHAPVPALAGSAAAAPIAGDPPEPTAPVVECIFDRHVRCLPALDNDRPYQRRPFEGCPATRPPVQKDMAFPDAKSQFSAAETRRARQNTPGVCCYVDFITGA